MHHYQQIDGLLLLLLVIPLSMVVASFWAQWLATLLFNRNTLPRRREKWEKVPEFNLYQALPKEPSAISPAARRFPGRVRQNISTPIAA